MCHKQFHYVVIPKPNQNTLIMKSLTFDSTIIIQMDLNNSRRQPAIFNVITMDGLHDPVLPYPRIGSVSGFAGSPSGSAFTGEVSNVSSMWLLISLCSGSDSASDSTSGSGALPSCRVCKSSVKLPKSTSYFLHQTDNHATSDAFKDFGVVRVISMVPSKLRSRIGAVGSS